MTGRLAIMGVCALAALALAACDADIAPQGTGVERTRTAAAGGGARAAATGPDVVRADVFSVTEEVIWDGRPTFSGMWIAYPDAPPERVTITNTQTGTTIQAAMYRRERDLPGSLFQISADAAVALGIVAGMPVNITVTAIRREQSDEPLLPVPATTPDGSLPDLPPLPDLPDLPPLGGDDAGAPLPDLPPLPPVPPAPDSGDAPAPAPALAAPASEPAAAAPPVAVPAPAAPASSLTRPYLQVGSFSIESYASDLRQILQNNGIPAIVRRSDDGGSALFRVVAGPSATAAEQAALIETLRSLGFADAFRTN